MKNRGAIDLRKLKKIEEVQAYLQGANPDHRITKKEAGTWIRRRLPKESSLQKMIIDGIEAEFPQAFVRKISLGAYSEAGFPDVLVIIDGLYFGIEVKRPIVGKATVLQERTMEQIREAGGVAGIACWPEEAIAMIRERLES